MTSLDNNHFNELEVTLDDKDYVQSVKPTLTYKRCLTCQRNQPISYYLRDERAADGYEKHCAECKLKEYNRKKSQGINARLRVAIMPAAVATQKAVVYAPTPAPAPAPAPLAPPRTHAASDIKDVLEMVEWAYSTLSYPQRQTLVRLLNALEETA